MQFVIYRDNGAQYHWRLMGDDGSKLAVSPSTFVSAEDARRAATEMRDSNLTAAGIDG